MVMYGHGAKTVWSLVRLVHESDFETLQSAGVDVNKGQDTSH